MKTIIIAILIASTIPVKAEAWFFIPALVEYTVASTARKAVVKTVTKRNWTKQRTTKKYSNKSRFRKD